MIKPETIDKIFDAARIEEVVGDFVTLKKRGVNLLGLCPFHNEKTPSFTVSPAKGIFKCFGCGKGGNAVNFIMEHEHFSYPEALKYLAGKYGIEVEEEKPSPEQQEALDEKESLFNLTAFAQKHFEETLHNTEEGKAIGLSYFKERGFTTETIKKFGLGYSLNNWDDFTSKALKHGYKKELLEKSSLVRTKDHQTYDTFRARVTFPIHNLSGRVLGFGARILTQDKKKPKYINTAESEIYHKSKVLYGLYFAKSAIVKEDNCYLTEGYTDVISLYQAGIENVISSSGTSLTTEQIKLIRRYTTNITLLFDGDPAGIKAAFRGIDMILEEGMNVKIVLFPDGEDPDSYARNYRPAEVKEFIKKNARDFISFKTNLLLEETQNDPIKKAALIKEIALSISQIPEPIARALYVQKSSDLLRIEEKLLMAEINKQRRERFKKRTGDPSAKSEQSWQPDETEITSDKQIEKGIHVDKQEKELIRLLLLFHDHEVQFEEKDENGQTTEFKYKVSDYIVDELTDDEITFDNLDCQKIFNEFVNARKQNVTLSDQYFFNHQQPSISRMAIDLTSSQHILSEQWENKHGIFVNKEEDNIKNILVEMLYALKLKKLEQQIYKNKEILQDEKDEEQILIHLENIKNLESIKTLIARELSRIVIQ
ncbi:MAG: DNA primase [Bacteroidetes bacterium]|nr:MAG: DNA primase [Bacteroidota bacterium]